MAGEPDQPVLTVEIGAGDYRLVAAPEITAVYSPPGQGFFCVEPVTHETDAFNRVKLDLLGPGATRDVHLRMTPKLL